MKGPWNAQRRSLLSSKEAELCFPPCFVLTVSCPVPFSGGDLSFGKRLLCSWLRQTNVSATLESYCWQKDQFLCPNWHDTVRWSVLFVLVNHIPVFVQLEVWHAGDGAFSVVPYVPISSLFRTSSAMFLRAVATDETTLSLSILSSSTRIGSPFSFLTAARMYAANCDKLQLPTVPPQHSDWNNLLLHWNS